MPERPFGKPRDRISFSFPRELVSIQRDDEKVLDIFTDSLAVRSPERSDRV